MVKVNEAVSKAAEKLPSLKEKFVDGKVPCHTTLSLPEVEEIYKQLDANPLELIYLKENFKQPEEERDVYEIKGTHDFLDEYAVNPKIKCCNTCKHLCGVTNKSMMPKPYCKVYEDYISNFNAKVYEDYCSSYCRILLPKPRQWFKENAPINLNMYGDTDTINGIKKEKMYEAKTRSVPNTVVRVNQIGFDD